jgi:hypothetical protein
MVTHKTILAPNAPWPVYEKVVPCIKIPKVKKVPPPKNPSKIAHTDKKFDEWAKKDKEKIYG